MWNAAEILGYMSEHLCLVDAQMREQQCYHGLDSLSEVQLHPVLCQAFASSPMGVVREVGYPSSAISVPKNRPNETQRQRCDLVLTPCENDALFDPIHEQREQDRALGTLFESFADEIQPEPEGVLPSDAFWLEVKSVGQFSYADGVPGVNPKYTSELLGGPRADVVKLASDPLIHHGAALVVVFSEERATGPHDIMTSVSAMIEQGLPISVPEFASIPIVNHAGNEWCTLGLIPIRL